MNSTARSTASWSMSIAASTAISASSEYGGRRSRYGSRARDGAIEYSTGELDIFPGRALPCGVSEECCGMVRDDDRHPVVLMNLSPQLADGGLRFQECLRGKCAESQNYFWFYELDLPNQVWAARPNLVRLGIPVTRRTVLENIADEYVLALELDRFEDLCQQL